MIIILNYHSVGDQEYNYTVTPEVFRLQLEYLRSHFRVIDLAELEEILISGKLPLENLAAITFDDGFRDNYLNAWPILRELSLPATIFIPTKFVGCTVTTSSGLKWSYLTWSEMWEMQSHGMISFQSHTHSHPVVTTLKSQTALVKEFVVSKNLLRARLARSVVYLAYPKGRSDKRSRSLAAEYFRLAFGGSGIINSLSEVDRFNLPRVTVRRSDNWWKFRILLSGIYWKIKHV